MGYVWPALCVFWVIGTWCVVGSCIVYDWDQRVEASFVTETQSSIQTDDHMISRDEYQICDISEGVDNVNGTMNSSNSSGPSGTTVEVASVPIPSVPDPTSVVPATGAADPAQVNTAAAAAAAAAAATERASSDMVSARSDTVSARSDTMDTVSARSDAASARSDTSTGTTTETLQASRYQHPAHLPAPQDQHLLHRKRKPDPNNELSVAFGSVGKPKKATKTLSGKHPAAPGPNSADNDKMTHTNELIRHDLEAKAFSIIRDHESARLADIQETLRSEQSTSAASITGTVPADADTRKYFSNFISAFNQGCIPDLKHAIETMMAPNGVYRTHVIRVPGQTHTRFTDKVVPAADLFDFYRKVLESFPDGFFKVELSKTLPSKDGTAKTLAGYFTFRGIVITVGNRLMIVNFVCYWCSHRVEGGI
jgi:hypothetical protein